MSRCRSPACWDSRAFTLVELLVVISIIALLISMLMPSLGRARDQAKGVHCLARLHDIGNAIAAYENTSDEALPPAEWLPDPDNRPNVRYGWCESIFEYIYKEKVYRSETGSSCPPVFPVQRNSEPTRWAGYFVCKAAAYSGLNSGHYRVYLPFWSAAGYTLDSAGSMGGAGDPYVSVRRSSLSPKALLIGDANERSHRGDGDLPPAASQCGLGDDGSFIDAGEANIAGPNGYDGNRFSDRHYGGTNYLFQDLHGAWDTKLREQLSRDWDLNGVADVASAG
jgi:prepilin-type N-terminal cleavage/methylation domain-containing protein/prepilin-type processing-associated H-X9-DG protein